jgi:hypothetical protein
MSETLGSLVDKLSIKSIREFHLREMLRSKKSKFPKRELKAKLNALSKQKSLLYKEIECFPASVLSGEVVAREEKLKLYNKPKDMGRIGRITALSKAIDGLAKKNLELWHLEDEARREDKPLSYTGKIKKRIDLANQQRNDLIDKIDEILEKKLKKHIK